MAAFTRPCACLRKIGPNTCTHMIAPIQPNFVPCISSSSHPSIHPFAALCPVGVGGLRVRLAACGEKPCSFLVLFLYKYPAMDRACRRTSLEWVCAIARRSTKVTGTVAAQYEASQNSVHYIYRSLDRERCCGNTFLSFFTRG